MAGRKTVLKAVAVHLSISWLSLLCAGQTIRCLSNRIISDETILLSPTHNITAFYDSMHIPSHSAKNISTAVWCTNNGNGNYVNMTFSQPVVIDGISSRGATSDNSQVHHYVSDFTMLYSKTVNGPLQLYSTEANFTATSATAKYTFVNSLAGLKFQFRINKFETDTLLCWGLRIFGCTLDNAVLQNSPCSITPVIPCTTKHSPSTVAVTVTVQPSCTTIHDSSPQTIPVVGIGAIGGGAAVLLVGVVMIVSAIAMCIATRRMKRSIEFQRRSTLSKNDNFALYQTTSSYENNSLVGTLRSADTAGPEYATVGIEPAIVAIPNQSYKALNNVYTVTK